MISGLDHITIRTADIAGTTAFFEKVLGLAAGWRPSFGMRGAWLYLNDRAVVHLIEADAPAQPSSGTSLDHVAFAIEDYDEVRRRLDEHGINYRANEIPGGEIRQLNVLDPSGATIELNWRKREAA